MARITIPELKARAPWQHPGSDPDQSETLDLLRNAGLRPTRQRIALLDVLLAGGDQHFTPEALYDSAKRARLNVSLATVYNTLRQFTSAGLLVQVTGAGARCYYDTNTSCHQHYLHEGEDILIDIPKTAEVPFSLPPPPSGYEIVRVDVIARLRPRAGSATS